MPRVRGFQRSNSILISGYNHQSLMTSPILGLPAFPPLFTLLRCVRADARAIIAPPSKIPSAPDSILPFIHLPPPYMPRNIYRFPIILAVLFLSSPSRVTLCPNTSTSNPLKIHSAALGVAKIARVSRAYFWFTRVYDTPGSCVRMMFRVFFNNSECWNTRVSKYASICESENTSSTRVSKYTCVVMRWVVCAWMCIEIHG